MGTYLIYCSWDEIKERIYSFLKAINFTENKEGLKEDNVYKISSNGKVSDVLIKAQWELERYDDYNILKLRLIPENKIKIKAILKVISILILLPILPKMIKMFWQTENIIVFILTKIPIVLIIILLFLRLKDIQKTRLLNKQEVQFKESFPSSKINIISPEGVSLMPRWAEISFGLFLCISLPILVFNIPLLFFLVLPFSVLIILNLSIYLISLKDNYFIWKALITGSLMGWMLVEIAIIMFVIILYINNLFFYVRYDEAKGINQITLKKALSTLYFKPIMEWDRSDQIKKRITMIKDIGDKYYLKIEKEHKERIRNFYIKLSCFYFGTVGIIFILLAIWLLIFLSKFLRKIPETWQLFLASNIPVSIMPPSLKSKSTFSQNIFFIILILWTLFAMPINFVFILFSFDMVYYLLNNTTLIFKELSILYSYVPTTFLLFGENLNFSKEAMVLSKLVLFYFSFPFLYLMIRWLSNMIAKIMQRAREKIKGVDIRNTIHSECYQKIIDISKTYHFKIPRILIIKTKKVSVYSRIGMLSRRATIIISQNIVNILNQKEIEAIIAHEIGHIRQGLRKKEILKILSRLALFPDFLLTILLNYRKMEILADRFALEITKDKESIINATIKMSTLNIVDNIEIQPNKKGRGLRLLSRIRKKALKFKILDEFLFGRFLVGYSHPEIKERLRELEKAY